MDKKDSPSNWIRTGNPPAVNPDDFLRAVSLFMAGASGKVTSAHMRRRGVEDDGVVYQPTDHPMNHGIMAVMDGLSHLTEQDRMALGLRLLSFLSPKILHTRRLAKWIIQDEGGVKISDSLIRAGAVADMNSKGFIIRSLASAAESFDGAEEGE